MLFVIMLLLISHCDAASNDLKLKSVLALSRHSVRTPITYNLSEYSPKEWPKWVEKNGFLTNKGALVEGYMGEFFKEWLSKEDVLSESCPEGDTVYIYANTIERTIETAKAFANSAFKDCNVTIHHSNVEEVDPIFSVVIHNTSEEFKKSVTKEMEEKLSTLRLTDALTELGRIIDLKNSHNCETEGYCDFTKDKNTIEYKVGNELKVNGPLDIGNSIVDIFIMTYYNGRPANEVAWGEITSPQQWELLTKIPEVSHDVRYNLTTACKDLAGPLLRNMRDILLDSNSTRKFTLLVGHESNLNTVIKSFDLQPYVLTNQYEPFPVSGKLVFEKWSDGVTDFLKLEYIYQSWSQVRDGAKIDFEDPPQRVTLELKGCKTDGKGYCQWDDFVQILKNMI